MADLAVSGYERRIWTYFKTRLGNEYGTAALMGNLYAESMLHPDIVQGDVPYSNYSAQYTANVDRGVITEYEFVHQGPNGGGYGLAQWTYSARKQGLYDWYKTGMYTSIGSISLALDYLWYELNQEYTSVLNVLKNATSVREASDKVLHDFERPADQSVAVEIKRMNFGLHYYELYAGTQDPQPATRKRMPVWMMCKRKVR